MGQTLLISGNAHNVYYYTSGVLEHKWRASLNYTIVK